MNDKPEAQPETRPDGGGHAVPVPAHAPISGPTARSASKVAELTTSKVLAGGMAAATSAVFGSHFGAFGTVGGAAVGSVVTTVGANLYQRSLERARDRVARQIPLPATLASRTSAGAGRAGSTPGVSQSGVTVPRVEAPVTAVAAPFPVRRLIGMSLVGVLLFFLVGLGVITGIEWVKGSPLSGGDKGTTVGQALSPVVRAAEPVDQAPVDQEPSETNSEVPSTEPSVTPGLGTDPGGAIAPKPEKGKTNPRDVVPTTPLVPTTPPVPTTPAVPTAPAVPSAPLPLPDIGLPGG